MENNAGDAPPSIARQPPKRKKKSILPAAAHDHKESARESQKHPSAGFGDRKVGEVDAVAVVVERRGAADAGIYSSKREAGGQVSPAEGGRPAVAVELEKRDSMRGPVAQTAEREINGDVTARQQEIAVRVVPEVHMVSARAVAGQPEAELGSAGHVEHLACETYAADVYPIQRQGADAGAKVSPMWMLGLYTIHTMGELCLSPIGLSIMTKLSTEKLQGMMMGMWFLASAYGQYVAGIIGANMATAKEGSTNMDALLAYTEGYKQLGLYAVIAGVVLIIISPLVKKLMQEVR